MGSLLRMFSAPSVATGEQVEPVKHPVSAAEQQGSGVISQDVAFTSCSELSQSLSFFLLFNRFVELYENTLGPANICRTERKRPTRVGPRADLGVFARGENATIKAFPGISNMAQEIDAECLRIPLDGPL